MCKEGGEPLNGNTGQRGASPASLYPFPWHVALWPLLGTDNSAHLITPKLPSFHSLPVPEKSWPHVSRPRLTQRGCPTAAQLGPRAELLPFLPTSIQRNRGHATSTVCPSAEDGQQLVLSHSLRQPAEKSSSIRQRLNVDTPTHHPPTPPSPHPPPPAPHPTHPAQPSTSLAPCAWCCPPHPFHR